MSVQLDKFHACFDQVEDPRVGGRTTHPMNSILLLVVAAVISDADDPEEIECFGKEKIQRLSKFADFSRGIPSHDRIGRVLSLIKPAQFQRTLLNRETFKRSLKQKRKKAGWNTDFRRKLLFAASF